MIKKIINLFVISLTLFLFSGCEKAPVNDSLEQQWILEEVTTLSDNQTVQCKRLFFSITYMVSILEEKQGLYNYGAYVARTSYADDNHTLILSDFKARNNTGDAKVDATIEQLRPFGINNPKETVFRVLELTHKRLVLESDYARLKLKKF